MHQYQTLLVIDDDAAISRLVKAHFNGLPIEVITEGTGPRGIQRAKREPIDLILLDVDMPDQNGFDVCRAMKADEATAMIPVVFLTGSNCDQDRLRAFEAGGVDYLTKPINPEELRARVGTALRVQRMHAERLGMEAALQEREAKLRAITSQLPALIWTTDSELLVTSVYGAALPRLAADPAVIVGGAIDQLGDVIGLEQQPTALLAAHNAALLGDSTRYSVQRHERDFDVRIEPLFDAEGRNVGTIGLAVDVTEQRLAEQAKRRQQSLEEAVAAMEGVISIIGHELRTPLAGLRAMSEYLLSRPEARDVMNDEFLRNMNEEIVRLSGMVNNLLEGARINSGRACWNWTEFDLCETCEHAVALIEPLIDHAKVIVKTEIDLPHSRVRGDADAIHRLLLNLLSNARSHTAEGEIRIALHEERVDTARWIVLELCDTGEGIPEQLRSKLGVPFALNSGVIGGQCISGSGLGIAICKGIAAAHGGTIAIDSEVGVGTRITVRFRADLDAAVSQLPLGDQDSQPRVRSNAKEVITELATRSKAA